MCSQKIFWNFIFASIKLKKFIANEFCQSLSILVKEKNLHQTIVMKKFLKVFYFLVRPSLSPLFPSLWGGAGRAAGWAHGNGCGEPRVSSLARRRGPRGHERLARTRTRSPARRGKAFIPLLTRHWIGSFLVLNTYENSTKVPFFS